MQYNYEDTEEGVIVTKDGKGWGETYSDGHSTEYGWMDINEAPIHNPRYCKRTTSVTYENSPYTKELESAELVKVKRTVRIETTLEQPIKRR